MAGVRANYIVHATLQATLIAHNCFELLVDLPEACPVIRLIVRKQVRVPLGTRPQTLSAQS